MNRRCRRLMTAGSRRSRARMNRSPGFTLLELVVVIAIVGIISAVALPRFIEAARDAHQVAVKRTAGALASAVTLVRAQYELNRSGGSQGCRAGNCQIDVQGFGEGRLDVNANGWPVGTERSGAPAATAPMDATACAQVFAATLRSPAAGADYRVSATGSRCSFRYRPDAGDKRIDYDAVTGDVNYSFN